MKKKLFWIIIFFVLSAKVSFSAKFISTSSNESPMGTYQTKRFPGSSPTIAWEFNTARIPTSISSTEMESGITNAYTMWDAVTTADIAFSKTGTSTRGRNSTDGYNVHSWSVDDDDLHEDLGGVLKWVACAIPIANDDDNNGTWEITDSDIVYNKELTTYWGQYNFKRIAAHEIGHQIGLGHPGFDGTIMSTDGATVNRSLHTDDIDGISFLYGGKIINDQVIAPSTAVGIEWDWNVQSNAKITISSKQIIVVENKVLNIWGDCYIHGNVVKGRGDVTWKGIKLWNTQNAILDHIKYCKIEDAEIGIRLYGAYNTRINNNEIKDCIKGIEVYNASNVKIDDNTIYNCSDTGIKFTAANSVSAEDNTIYNCYKGIYSVSAPSPPWGNIGPDNHIRDSQVSNVEVGGYSTMNIRGSILENSISGYDTQFCFYNQLQGEGDVEEYNDINSGITNQYHVYNDNSSHTVDAENNYWYNSVNNAPVLGGPGAVDYNPGTFYKQSSFFDNAAKEHFAQAVQLKKDNNIDAALAKFKTIVDNYSEHKMAKLSLNDISGLLMRKENPAEKGIGYFKDLRNSLISFKSGSRLLPHVNRHLLFWLQNDRQYKEADRLYCELITSGKDFEKVADLVYRRAIMLKNDLGREEEAIALLQEMVKKDCAMADIAVTDLKLLGADVPEPEPQNKEVPVQSELLVPDDFGLEQNFPNPFNPVTTVKYNLPEASFVTLKVYNVLGQEIANLVSSDKPAGFHSVKWDASKIASGTYIYKITAGDFTAARKMILIK